MPFLSEIQLEAALLEQFASLGYACTTDELIGPDGKQSERDAYDEVIRHPLTHQATMRSISL